MVRSLAAALALAVLAGLLPAPVGADDRCLLLERSADAASLLDPFPPPGSPDGAADLAIVLWAQRTRTPGEVARVKAEEGLSLEDFAGALGAGFRPAEYPETDELLARAARAARPCVGAVKHAYARPRPYTADPRVAPAAELEPTDSYPSGHATRGALFAAILAELAPSRREALLRRGEQIGEDRVIAGVHYPSDVTAGQRLGAAIARALLAEPAFRAALEETRLREWHAPARTSRRSRSP